MAGESRSLDHSSTSIEREGLGREPAGGERQPAAAVENSQPALLLHRAVGNRAVGRLLKPPSRWARAAPRASPEPKGWMGAPGSVHERAAERIAGTIAAPSAASPAGVAGGEAEAESATSEEGAGVEALPAMASPGSPADSPPDTTPLPSDVLARIAATRGGGRGLAPHLRAFFAARLGRRFERVRVHADGAAADLSQELGSAAFAVGQDVYFGQGRYQPDTPDGLRLLAHELVHVVQQERGASLVQRDPLTGARPTTIGDPEITHLGPEEGELVMREWPEQGLAEVSYHGKPWIMIRYTAGSGRRVANNLAFEARTEGRSGTVRITFSGNLAADAYVDRAAEQEMSNRTGVHLIVEHRYEYRGQIHFNQDDGSDRAISAPGRLRHDYVPNWWEWPEKQFIRRIQPEPGPQEEAGPEAPLPAEIRPRVWTFDSVEMFDRFAETHPDTVWAGIEGADGKIVAYALTREARARMAERIREGRSDFEFLEQFPGRVVRYYENGNRLESLQSLADLYYRSAHDAAEGTDVDPGEAEVYHMGGGFYGRKHFTHAEALARLRELDGLEYGQILALETEPGKRFEALRVRTHTGLHTLNFEFFQARKEFFEKAESWNTANLIYEVGREERGGQRPLNFYITHARRMGPLVRNYLLVETSREESDPRFHALLERLDQVAFQVAEEIGSEVERIGQRFAIASLQEYVNTLNELATSEEAMQRFVLTFHELPEERQWQALGMLGIERIPYGSLPFMVPYYVNPEVEMIHATLADRASAWRVALGVPDELVGIEDLQGRAKSSAASVEGVLRQLREWEITALYLEGDLGEQVRAHAYRQMGFKLDPTAFPHDDVTDEFLPSPLSGETSDFTSLSEQMYANLMAHRDDANLLVSMVVGTAVVAGIVLLILVANAAGVAAAAFFGGGAVTEVVVSGLAFTALSEIASQALTGTGAVDWEDPAGSAARLGGQAAVNIATFGFFRVLNAVFLATSRAGVSLAARAVPALRGAGAARVATGGLRLSSLGLSFIGLSLAEFRHSRGRMPNDNELILLVHQSLTMLVMLEAGGALARPHMQRLSLWARPDIPPNLVRSRDALRSDIHTLRRDLASLAVRPDRAPQEERQLVQRHEELLQRQRDLLDQLRSAFRTSGEARNIEREAAEELAIINEQLARLRQVRFLVDADIRPRGLPEQSDVLEYDYPPGKEAEIRTFYGERNVRGPDAQGVLRVQHEGRQLVFHPRQAGAATPAAPLQGRAEALAGRQRSVLARADRLGVTGGTIDAIRPRRLRPQTATRRPALDRAEQLITAAERHVDQAVRQRAAGALLRHTDRLGEQRIRAGDTRLAGGEEAGARRLGREAMDRIRSGQLEGMADREVGEMLLQIPTGTQGLGEAQMRGLLYAARGAPAGSSAQEVSIRRIFELERSAAERNFMLETFAQLMDARIPGTYDVLSAMTSGRNNWKGGTWMFEYARLGVGIDRLARFEVRVIDPATGAERRYDLVTTSGERLELKDWARWFGVRRQFRRDILLNTSDLTDPAGLSNVRWVFRAPAAGRTEAEIRQEMTEALNGVMDEFNVPVARRVLFQIELAANDKLIEISDVNRQRTPPPARTIPPPSPAPLPDDEEPQP